jgi:hypothetical protein
MLCRLRDSAPCMACCAVSMHPMHFAVREAVTVAALRAVHRELCHTHAHHALCSAGSGDGGAGLPLAHKAVPPAVTWRPRWATALAVVCCRTQCLPAVRAVPVLPADRLQRVSALPEHSVDCALSLRGSAPKPRLLQLPAQQ